MRYYGKRRGGFKRTGDIKGRENKEISVLKKESKRLSSIQCTTSFRKRGEKILQ
jgi:hypothetical protein